MSSSAARVADRVVLVLVQRLVGARRVVAGPVAIAQAARTSGEASRVVTNGDRRSSAGRTRLYDSVHSHAAEVRRHRHRRGPQRPDGGGVSGARRPQGARARAAPRRRRRGGHRRDLSRLQVLRLLVRRVAAAARDHPRPRSGAARPRDSAARRHVHADAQRRLPVARRTITRSTFREIARHSRARRRGRTTSTAGRWSRWAASRRRFWR